MVNATVIRPATVDEKKEFIELGHPTFHNVIRKKVIEEESKHTKAHRPFCFRCAKLDVQDKVDSIMKENSRMSEHGTPQNRIEKIEMSNFSEYGNPKMFTLLDTKEINEDKLLDGIRTSVLVGYNMIYRCKKRGCGNTVFVPLKIYNERYNIKPKE